MPPVSDTGTYKDRLSTPHDWQPIRAISPGCADTVASVKTLHEPEVTLKDNRSRKACSSKPPGEKTIQDIPTISSVTINFLRITVAVAHAPAPCAYVEVHSWLCGRIRHVLGSKSLPCLRVDS